jgi:hypothetical protein
MGNTGRCSAQERQPEPERGHEAERHNGEECRFPRSGFKGRPRKLSGARP